MFDSSFFFHLFPIMFRYIDVTLGISLAALLLALLIAVVIAAAGLLVAFFYARAMRKPAGKQR